MGSGHRASAAHRGRRESVEETFHGSTPRMGELWNHWFWVTLALGVFGSSCVGSESLSIDSAGQHLAQHGEEFPPGRGGKGDWFQRERTEEEENEGGGERVIEGGKETVSVSQSSSVSKVSVKMGGVSISGRDTKELRGERKLAAGFNQLEADVRQSFFQQLLDRLQNLAEWSKEGEEETHHHLNSLEEAPVGYQLIYRDDEVDDYTDYYGIPYVYYTDEDYADILEEEQLRLEESWQAPESLAASPMELLPRLPEEGRSSFARGRALTFDVADKQGEKKAEEMLEIIEEEAEKEESEEVSASVSVGVRLPNVATTPTDEVEKEAEEEVGRRSGDTQEEEEEGIAAEVLIDRSKVELLTFRNKIGIFIGVVMIVLTISVVLGMISVSLRRARRGKRMMKEDEISQADTVSTVMETSSYTGLPDSVYSNYIRKSSLSCDELTELDNDSFLTSLEPISVMDRFGWD